MDVALDSALEAFPEEELVRRDQVFSLMTNFKAALTRARQAEDRVKTSTDPSNVSQARICSRCLICSRQLLGRTA